jgi:hypothetical protein
MLHLQSPNTNWMRHVLYYSCHKGSCTIPCIFLLVHCQLVLRATRLPLLVTAELQTFTLGVKPATPAVVPFDNSTKSSPVIQGSMGDIVVSAIGTNGAGELQPEIEQGYVPTVWSILDFLDQIQEAMDTNAASL